MVAASLLEVFELASGEGFLASVRGQMVSVEMNDSVITQYLY